MLRLKNISKSYTIGDFSQNALDNVSVNFKQTDFVAVLGPSGCGKTTLLNVIGGLDHADKGDLFINGKSTKDFKDSDWDMYRNNTIGFIFQSHNLIAHLSVLQNVEMGLTLSGVSKAERQRRAIEVLTRVGLKDHIHKRPNQLSGGQSQRVAVARALANNPEIILADEPTGSLDSESSLQIMELIKEIAQEKLVILVTHDSEQAEKFASRLIQLKDGQIISDSRPVQEDVESKSEVHFKKTSMSFKTAFISSINNIRTKLGRTILTAFAGSIGIIGIALILSLSNGLDQQIQNFEEETLSGYPIEVTESKLDFSKMSEIGQEEYDPYPDQNYASMFDESQFTSFLQPNFITEDYLQYVYDYVDGEGVDTLSGVKYDRYINMSLLTYVDIASSYVPIYQEEKEPADDASSLGPAAQFMNIFTLLPDGEVFDNNYDLIYGLMPANDLESKQIEIVLVVDEYNRLFKSMLEQVLGLDVVNNETFAFDDIVGQTYKLFIGEYNIFSSSVAEAYDVTISGIIRSKPGSNVTLLFNGFAYTSDVPEHLYDTYPDETGDIKSISLYPKDFDAKDLVKGHLDAYNTDLAEDDKIAYIDRAATFTSLIGGVIDTISIVLIAFAAISLVVSSIMISIITYVSVIERTKEIGVLRALGARKKDISRIFNVENIVIGFGSGFVGVTISLLLIIPINLVIEHFADMANVAKLSAQAAIFLILISMTLAVIAGLIPARMAAKKDPVIALRTE